MEFLKNKKVLIGIVITILALGIVIYFVFKPKAKTPAEKASDPSTVEAVLKNLGIGTGGGVEIGGASIV